jgi:hypothetical protein
VFWIIVGLIVVSAMALGGSPGARAFLGGLGTIAKVFLGCAGVILLAVLVMILLFYRGEPTKETKPAPKPAATAPARKSPAPPRQAPATASASEQAKTRPSGSDGDPCAVGISGEERLRRMEKLGTVRQIGSHTYEVGNHLLVLDSTGTGLILCR